MSPSSLGKEAAIALIIIEARVNPAFLFIVSQKHLLPFL